MHQGIKPHLHSTKASWGKRNIFASSRQERETFKAHLTFWILLCLWNTVLLSVITCFQSPSLKLKLKLWTPQVLSPKVFRKGREKGWYLMGRRPPKEMTEFLEHLWEIPHSHHCFTTNVVITGLELVSYGKRILLCLNQNENYTISSLFGTTFRQARWWEKKPVPALWSRNKWSSLMIKTALTQLVTGTTLSTATSLNNPNTCNFFLFLSIRDWLVNKVIGLIMAVKLSFHRFLKDLSMMFNY